MNIDRLTELAVQLERGAPGVAFYMGTPRMTIEQALVEYDNTPQGDSIEQQRDEKGLGAMDVACCIDGYAIQLFEPDYRLGRDIVHDPYEQECHTRTALHLLGLPWMEKGPKWDCGHELFEIPDRWWEYSPERAAQAVRRLLADEKPLFLRAGF